MALALTHSVPPLHNGDHLTRAEFERRYNLMPEVKKAELIDGIVYIPGRVPHTTHGQPHALAGGWLGIYFVATPGIDAGNNCTLRLDEDNEPQPDLLLRLPESAGGKSRLSKDDYIEGPVELVVEIAASSVSLDMHAKLNVYRRHGVREYLVWRVHDKQVDWFAAREGRFEPLPRDAAGVIRSEVFPGLWLDTAALIALDLPRVLATLAHGTASPEHAAFVDRLKASADKR